MPTRGKKTGRLKERPLSRSAALIAGDFLRSAICVEAVQQTKMTDAEKSNIVAEVNNQFRLRQIVDQRYTVQKLDDWIGNAVYKHRLAQRKHRPGSWQPKQRTARRRKAARPLINGQVRIARHEMDATHD